MNWAGVKVGVGTKFMYDGEIIEVVETHMVDGAVEVMTKDLRAETVRRFALSELMFSERARLLADDLGAEIAGMAWDPATVKWAAASPSVRREACARAAHVRESADWLPIRTCRDRAAWRTTRRVQAGNPERKTVGGQGR